MKRTRIILAVILFLLFSSLPQAMAQRVTPFEIGVGYNVLHDFSILGGGDIDMGVTLPLGWNVSCAANMTERLAIAGEVGGNYKTEDTYAILDWSIHTFMGGVQYSFRKENRRFFFQALAGVARVHLSSSDTWRPERIYTDLEVATQFGAGMDFNMSEKMAFRVQADFRQIYGYTDGTAIGFRLGGGIVFYLGN